MDNASSQHSDETIFSANSAKPIIKWVGGKTQLVQDIVSRLPADFDSYDTYIEPFIGGGAFLLHVLKNYHGVKNVVLNDLNRKLITLYHTVKENSDALIKKLKFLEADYLPRNEPDRKSYFLKIREQFNESEKYDDINISAWFIFLNKTCFNGLYRENSKGGFNVPFGRYDNPMICDEKNLRAVSLLLQNVTILCGDFSDTLQYAQGKTLFYFDPPYKPLSNTSSFNSYSKKDFEDEEQIRLGEFCREIDELGHKFILTNSDVKGKNPNKDFFDDLYDGFEIQRVYATRSINSNPSKRGKLTELMVSNF
ncbi:MAG: DNA adenine methylase [Lentisphaerae bacterium]|nr:DNA adenine methylase [Lentisphaerota bacterium]